MQHSRETIAVAFFALFGTVGDAGNPFAYISRVLEVPANVNVEPALYWVEDYEDPSQSGVFGTTKYELKSRVVVFGAMPDRFSGTAPGSVLNPLLDFVDQAIGTTSPPDEKQTLGGLVINAYMSGRIVKAEGYLGPHVAAVIPVTILTGV